ncbi:regulatory LuxR family protein [Palleronia aestuarii]|uniref:Regulatory LuxR family protein n=1 Tax=Palleronia aestuarii TaxID=568105 RepID=A0A2W7MQS1_9RHOB|nr:helix-turn-helix transcriptional regulator [Palleronia aestuarii]PZX10290.1 regulatory LuxR family protein [Palleronia aestuarii]
MAVPIDTAERRLGQAIAALGTNGFAACFYAWLRHGLDCDNATMLAYFQDRRPEILYVCAAATEVHENLENAYLPGAYLLDPFHDLHVRKVPPGLYRLREIAPDAFTRNEYYAAYYRATTLIDEIAYVSYPAPGVSVHVCLGRDAGSGRPFSAGNIGLARKLEPIARELCIRQWSALTSSGDYADATIAGRVIAAMRARHAISLSPRQAEVALLILRGHSSVSIGLRLGISPQTVKVFRRQLYRKCNISSTAELFALVMPLLSEPPPKTGPAPTPDAA